MTRSDILNELKIVFLPYTPNKEMLMSINDDTDLIRDLKIQNPNILESINIKQKIAREFEDAVVESLVYKTIKAIKE